jgi:hypothetical protein
MSDSKNLSLVSIPSQNLETINPETQISLTEIERLAVHFAESGLFGIGKQAQSQCIVKMFAGKDLGIGPFTAIKEIYIIQGRMTLSSHLMALLIKKHPLYNYKIKEHTDQLCSIEFFENGESQGISTFTLDDAKKAGLTTDQKLYSKYTKNMLYSRAMSNGAKWYCPLVFGGGVYTPEEIQETTEQSFIDIPKKDENLKSDFISSILKLEQAIMEVSKQGHTFVACNYGNFTLEVLKNEMENRSNLLKVLLVDTLISKKQPKEQLQQMTVVDLYNLYQQRPIAQ